MKALVRRAQLRTNQATLLRMIVEREKEGGSRGLLGDIVWDTAGSPSRRGAQTWRSLFVAPCTSSNVRSGIPLVECAYVDDAHEAGSLDKIVMPARHLSICLQGFS